MGGFTDSWLAVEKGLGGIRPILRGTAEEMRGQFAGLGSALASQYPPVSGNVATADGQADGIAYRVYTPLGYSGRAAPTFVFYHSGGFVLGNLESEDQFCRALALRAGVFVLSVDYRLAPEHKAPAQLNDALAFYEWAYHNASMIGIEAKKMFAIGTSAGGALALSVTRKVVTGSSSLPRDAVKGVFALCPVTLHPDHVPDQLKGSYTAYEENGENVPLVDKTSLMDMFQNVGARPDDESLFVCLDQSCMKLFPPTYIVTSEKDPLRDDGCTLKKLMEASGGAVKYDHYEGLPHCFWMFPSLPETALFMDKLATAVEWVQKY